MVTSASPLLREDGGRRGAIDRRRSGATCGNRSRGRDVACGDAFGIVLFVVVVGGARRGGRSPSSAGRSTSRSAAAASSLATATTGPAARARPAAPRPRGARRGDPPDARGAQRRAAQAAARRRSTSRPSWRGSPRRRPPTPRCGPRSASSSSPATSAACARGKQPLDVEAEVERQLRELERMSPPADRRIERAWPTRSPLRARRPDHPPGDVLQPPDRGPGRRRRLPRDGRRDLQHGGVRGRRLGRSSPTSSPVDEHRRDELLEALPDPLPPGRRRQRDPMTATSRGRGRRRGRRPGGRPGGLQRARTMSDARSRLLRRSTNAIASDHVDRQQLDALEPRRLALVGDVVGDQHREQQRAPARSR